MAKSKIKGLKSIVKKVTASVFKQYETHLKTGDKAPYFEGPDQDGKIVSLDNFKGKTLVLYFYPKDNTPTCTTESCSLRDEYKFLAKQNYAVVGVSADSVKSHKKFATKFSLPFPLIADEDMKIIKAYDVWGKKMLFGRIYDGIVRTTFIIENGKIQRVISDVDSAGHGKQVMEL
jgi:peroxiredoxin Q/BCP